MERRDLARAYEEADGSLTVVSEDEDASARAPRSTSLNVIAFAAAAEVNPRLLDRSYYLTPEPTAAHAFAVLLRALLRLHCHGHKREPHQNSGHARVVEVRRSAGSFGVNQSMRPPRRL